MSDIASLRRNALQATAGITAENERVLAELRAQRNVPDTADSIAPTPEPLPEYAPWNEIESSVAFAELSYQEQQLARAKWFDAMAPRDEGLSTLSPQERRIARTRFISSPASVIAEDLSTRGRQFLELGQQLANEQSADISLERLGDRLAGEDDSAEREVKRSVFGVNFAENSVFAPLVSRLAERFLGPEAIEMLGGNTQTGEVFYRPQSTADQNAYDYMISMASRNRTFRDRLAQSATRGALGGGITDVVTSLAATQYITRPLAAVAAAAKSGAYAGRAARVLATPGVAFLGESLIESVPMTFADLQREVVTEEVTRFPEVANRVARAALLYGSNVVLDMSMWTVWKLAARTGREIGNVFTRGMRGGLESGQTVDESLELMRESLRGIDPAVAAQGTDEVVVAAWREHHQALSRMAAETPDTVEPETWMRTMADLRGYPITEAPGGGFTVQRRYVTRTGKPRSTELGTFATVDDAFRRAVDDMDNRMGIDVTKADTVTGTGQTVRVSQVVEGTDAVRMAKSSPSPLETMRLMMPDSTGQLRSGNVRTALRNAFNDKAFKEAGLNADNIFVREVDLQTWRKRLRRAPGTKPVIRQINDGIEIDIPAGSIELTELEALNTQIARLAQDISIRSPSEAGFKRIRSIARSIEKGSTKVSRNLFKEARTFVGRRGWVSDPLYQLRQLGKTIVDPKTGRVVENTAELQRLPSSGAVGVRGTDGTVTTYRSMDEALRKELDKTWVTEPYLKRWMKQEFGLDLVKHEVDGEERLFIRRGKNSLRANNGYRSLDELLEQNIDLFPPRPINSLTQEVEFDYLAKTVTFENNVIKGSPQEVIDAMNGAFARTTDQEVVTTAAGRVKFSPETTKFRVEMPDIGFQKEFATAAEAKDFLKRSLDDYEAMNDIALAAGTEVEFLDGVFRMRLPDGSYAVSRTLEGIRPAMKDLVFETDIAPSLLRGVQLPEGHIQNLQKKYRQFFGESLGTPKIDKVYDHEVAINSGRIKLGDATGAKPRRKAAFWRPFEAVARGLSRDIGDPQLLTEVYKKPLVMYNIVRQKLSAVERHMGDVYKGFSRKDMKALTEAFIHPERSVEEIFQQMGAKNVERAAEALRATREAFNLAFEEFGIDGYKFLTDYMPRIRRALESGDEAIMSMKASEFFRKDPNLRNFRNAPELDFFGEHLRVKDLYEYSRDITTGLDQVLYGYYRKGLMSKYMKGAADDAHRYVKQLFDNNVLDEDHARFLVSYVDELAGLSVDRTKQQIFEGIEDVVKGVWSKVSGRSPDEISLRNMVRTVQAATIGAHMAMRPFLAVRNLMQVWATLGWRIGDDVVFEALDIVNKNPQSIARELIEADIILHGKPAMLEMLNTKSSSVLEHLVENGMFWFRNSDDYNRAVTAISSWIPYDRAVGRLEAGTITADEFLSVSRLDRMPQDIREDVLKYTEVGDHRTAKNILAREWVNQTQFPYIQAGNPRMYKGTIGKLFGMYGHYPAMYRENIVNAFRPEVPMRVKLGSAAQLALNTGALYMVFQNVFGISASNFNPIGQSLFSGGPYYAYINNVLASTQMGYRGDIARSDLFEQTVRTFVPGSAFAYSFGQGRELLEKGYLIEGLLRLLTFPVRDPTRPTAR